MKSIPRSIAFFLMALPFAFFVSQRQYLPPLAVGFAAVMGWFLFSAATLCLIRHLRN